MVSPAPTGVFTCDVTLQVRRAPEYRREEKEGVTILVARGYELAYETVLRFTSGSALPVRAKLVAELNKQVVVRSTTGNPVLRSGYVQGLFELSDDEGRVMFRGHYYDSRVVQPLSGGDEPSIGIAPRLVDHWENGFGEGAYAGHVFSMGVQLRREGRVPLRGQGQGQID